MHELVEKASFDEYFDSTIALSFGYVVIEKNNNKINWLHERCLRIIYHDKQSSF